MKKTILVLLIMSIAVISFCAKEIVFWNAWGGDEGKALDSIIDRYNKSQSKVYVRSVYVPIGMGEKIMTTLSGSTTPDVITVWDWMVVPLGYRGQIISMNDRLSKAGVTSSDYIKGVWEYGTYKGKKYGLPTTLNVSAFMWNKNAFKEVGLNPDVPPKTIEELDEFTDKLNKYDKKGALKRLGFDPVISHIYCYVFGGQLWDPETSQITANHQKNIEAYEWLSSYYKKVDLQKKRIFQAGWGDLFSSLNPFLRGEIAMKEGSQWEILIAKKYGKTTFDYGISNFPAPQGGRNDVCNVSGSFWVIPTASKNQDEAFEFLTWLTADKQAAEFAAALYNIPPKVKALEDNAFKTIVDDKMKIYIDMLMNGYVYTFPMLPIGQAYLTELTQALMDVQLGNKTAKEALDYVQERINQELKNYK